MGKFRTVEVDDDPWKHFAAARQVVHPAIADCELDPMFEFTLSLYMSLGPQVVQWRAQLIEELEALVEEFAPDCDSWWLSLPQHVKDAYGDGKQVDSRINGPLLFHLLSRFQYPGASSLFNQVSFGFNTIGDMVEGIGWPSREFPKPEQFLSESDFVVLGSTCSRTLFL